MSFHLPSFIQSQRSGLFEKPCRQSDLADVVDQTTKMREPLFIFAQPKAGGNITRIDRHSGRVTGCVSVPGIEGGDESAREGQARPLESTVGSP